MFYTTLLCEVVIPIAIFVGGVAYASLTFTLAALLLFPLFILLEYATSLTLVSGKDSNLSPVPFATPPLYPIVHQAGVVMFLLAFGKLLSPFQQVLLVVSYLIGYLGVLTVGKHAIAKVNWQALGRSNPTHESLVLFSLLLSVEALAPIYAALHAKLLWVAIALFITLCLGMPHPPFSQKAGRSGEANEGNC